MLFNANVWLGWGRSARTRQPDYAACSTSSRFISTSAEQESKHVKVIRKSGLNKEEDTHLPLFRGRRFNRNANWAWGRFQGRRLNRNAWRDWGRVNHLPARTSIDRPRSWGPGIIHSPRTADGNGGNSPWTACRNGRDCPWTADRDWGDRQENSPSTCTIVALSIRSIEFTRAICVEKSGTNLRGQIVALAPRLICTLHKR